jgi:hypothetical protein
MHSPGASRDIKSSHTPSFPKHEHCKVDHRTLANQSEGRRLSLNKRKPVRYKKICITSVYRRQCDAVQFDLTFHSHTELLGEKFIEKETKANVKPGTGKFIFYTKIFI